MKIINGVCKGIDKVNDLLGKIFSVLVLAILAVILCEVILRRLFNSPQIWTQDLTVMLFASYTILICAYGFQKKAFVAVDVVFVMLPKIAQYVLHIVTYLCFLCPFVFWIVPKSFNFFLRAYSTNEQTYSVWAAPTWPEGMRCRLWTPLSGWVSWKVISTSSPGTWAPLSWTGSGGRIPI